MPGLYVNDGGGLSSALGNALAGLSTLNDPKTAAEALALKYQTEAADIANQAASEGLQTKDNAINTAPGLPGQPGAISTGGIMAGLAVPPLVGGLRHPAGTVLSANPLTAQVQNQISLGQATPAALQQNIIPLGQTLTTGPGTDITTQTAIANANMQPYDLGAGTVRHFPTNLGISSTLPGSTGTGAGAGPNGAGAGGGTTVSGPSSYANSGETAGGTSDDALAARDLENGAASKVTIGRADLMDQLYDRLDQLGTNSPSEITKDLAVEALSRHLGLDLSRYSDVASMKAAIRVLGLGLTGTLKTTQGDPMPRGSLDAIQAMAADPNTPPNQFHQMIAVIKNVAQGQADNYDAALKFRTDRPKPAEQGGGDQAGIAYHTARGQNAAAQGKALSGLAPPAGPPLPSNVPPAAITHLKQHPEMAPDFDAKYGPGSSKIILGQ